jgi:hypothetical protein
MLFQQLKEVFQVDRLKLWQIELEGLVGRDLLDEELNLRHLKIGLFCFVQLFLRPFFLIRFIEGDVVPELKLLHLVYQYSF